MYHSIKCVEVLFLLYGKFEAISSVCAASLKLFSLLRSLNQFEKLSSLDFERLKGSKVCLIKFYKQLESA